MALQADRFSIKDFGLSISRAITTIVEPQVSGLLKGQRVHDTVTNCDGSGFESIPVQPRAVHGLRDAKILKAQGSLGDKALSDGFE